jgi:PPP family 3-phenylpropionic acid transporter
VSARVRQSAAIHGLFVSFGFVIAAFFPFLSLYLESRGLSASQIGAALAVAAVARIIANPIWGHLADTTIGRRTALQIGAVGAGMAALAIAAAAGVLGIIAFGAVLAIFMVTTGPNIDAIALEHLGAEQMSEYGKVRSWESLSYAGSVFVIGLLLQLAGMTWAMPIYALAALILFAWSFTVGRDRPHRLEDHGRLGAVGAVFRAAPRFWGFLVSVFLVWTGFNAAWNFIGITIAARGGGPLLIGIGAALGGLVEVPVMRSSPRMQRRFGLRRMYTAGCALYAVGYLLWGSVTNPTILSLLTVFEGLAFATLFTSGVVIVGRMLPPSLYSTGNSVAQMVGFGLGPIVGAGLGGLIYEATGPFTLYVAAAACAIAAAIVAWFVLDLPALEEPAETRVTLPADAL